MSQEAQTRPHMLKSKGNAKSTLHIILLYTTLLGKISRMKDDRLAVRALFAKTAGRVLKGSATTYVDTVSPRSRTYPICWRFRPIIDL